MLIITKYFNPDIYLIILTAASDPLVGSVKQNAANFSPVASYNNKCGQLYINLMMLIYL